MNILIAPDSFKECLDAKDVALAIEEGIMRTNTRALIFPRRLPLSDGGEGFLERIVEANGGHLIRTDTVDPLGNPIEAEYGVINHDTAVIESARTCGLALDPKGKRDPKVTTSYGVGLLIIDALSKGFQSLPLV